MLLRLSAALLLAAPLLAQEVSTPLTEALDRAEARAEEIGHALLDFAAATRRRDAGALVRHLGATVEATPFPPKPVRGRKFARWVKRHEWTLAAKRRPVDAASFAAEWLAFVATHREVDDLRVGVVRDEGESLLLKVEIVGRDGGGRRLWTRGRARARWKQGLVAFAFEELHTLRAARTIFRDVAAEAGLAATDPPALAHPTLGLAAYGAAAADVDGDGRIDLFSTGHDKNRLYLNRGGGKFETREIATPHVATGALFLDYDNDGDADLFCSANGPQMLLENRRLPDGELRFVDVSERAGVAVKTIGFSIAAGDLNGDGFPDLYVTAYNNFGPVLPDSWDAATNGLPNLLFESRGDGTFAERAAARGVAGRDWSYAAQIADVDGDGRLDLYVANDFGSGNRLHMNRGDRFVDEARERGLLDAGYAMGVCFGDYDNDGDLDLHVSKMSSKAGSRILARFRDDGPVPRARLAELGSGNSLYRNDGGRFTDVSAAVGPLLAGWSWGGGFLDIDNDGYEDLHAPNGHLSGASMKDT